MLLEITKKEKINIENIHSNLLRNNLTISLNSTFDSDEVLTLYHKYRILHPEMVNLCITGPVKMSGVNNMISTITLTPKTGYNKTKNAVCQFDLNDVRALDNRCDKILKELRINNKSQILKAMAIFDYLSTHVIYDKTDKDNAYDPWGALMDGRAVCNGIAYAYQLLARKCGLDVGVIVGKLDGESHAWNLIEIEGLTYHLDATANLHSGDEYKRLYNFIFLKDDDMKAMRYEWNKRDYPVCNSEKHNYFIRMNSYAKTTQDVVSIMCRQLSNKNLIYLRTDPSLKLDSSSINEYVHEASKKANVFLKQYLTYYNPNLHTFFIKYTL